jgi:hypothetical protein
MATYLELFGELAADGRIRWVILGEEVSPSTIITFDELGDGFTSEGSSAWLLLCKY